MAIEFIYFDLGKVLLEFTHECGFQQVAEACGSTPDRVKQVLFDSGLSDRYEKGELSTAEFHEEFCKGVNKQVALNELTLAWSNIFELNTRTMTIAASLKAAGNRIGILSNTSAAHWEYASSRFHALSTYFDPVVTSYEAKSMKPHHRIYDIAAERVSAKPEQIFFVDDRQENVDGALALGWQAKLYTNALTLSQDLEDGGIPFNR